MTDSRRTDEAGGGRPLAEPGRQRPGADVGGMAANAEGGLQDALQRRTERRDDDPTGATIGSASAGGLEPRLDLGGKAEPGSAAGAPAPDRSGPGSPTARHAGVAAGTTGPGFGNGGDQGRRAGAPGDAWRATASPSRPHASGADASHRSDQGSGSVAHDPDEPPDEGPLESLGRAVSEALTGPVQDREEHDPDTPPRRR
jgi:hypothetical protein